MCYSVAFILQQSKKLIPRLLVLQLPKEAVLNYILDSPVLHEWFEGATSAGNPDALLLALKIQQKIGTDSNIFGSLLPHPFSPKRFFTADHLTCVANCLKVNLSPLFPLSVCISSKKFELYTM